MGNTSNTFDNITLTDKNLDSSDAVFDATVVANYGDPGLAEDYHADFLSKFVICKLESSNRTLTSDKFKNMIIVVKRPETLWISYDGGFLNNPANQRRVDYNLNANVGSAGNYSTNVIPAINIPYSLGDRIKVKLIKDENYSYLTNKDSFFSSQCNVWDASSSAIGYYQGWHNQGLNSNPYVSQNNGASNIQIKTIFPTDNTNTFYTIALNKTQYEAFSLTMYPEQAANLIALFSNTSSFKYYYKGNGGYSYQNEFMLNLNFLKYEDMNTMGRARTTTTNCIPLIVSAPNTFTAPAARAAGTVNYLPTYITKA